MMENATQREYSNSLALVTSMANIGDAVLYSEGAPPVGPGDCGLRLPRNAGSDKPSLLGFVVSITAAPDSIMSGEARFKC